MNKNREIANIFAEIGDILDLLAENPFKIRAYRKASRSIAELREDIEQIAERDELTDIDGVGKDLANKIKEYLETGGVAEYTKLRKKVPEEVTRLLSIQGLGPKTLSVLFQDFGVTSVEDLEMVLDSKKFLELKGMGKKKIEDIKRGVEIFKQARDRTNIGVAMAIAEVIVARIEALGGTEGTVCAGSIRRMKETVGDIDILTMADDTEAVVEEFTKMPFVQSVLASGSTKGSVITTDGIQVDLRVMPPESYGAALLYFTGSVDHNVKLRGLALKQGFSINEYAITRDDNYVAGETEKEIYKTLGMPFVPPELRENRGEIEAALEGTLPELIELGDVRGDLHTHSIWSDGRASVEEMVEAARGLGYNYIAITDHSPSSRIANGLSIERLLKKKNEIDKIRKKQKDIKILMGTEVDILSDGTLDYPDEVLAELDIVIASVHSGFKMERRAQTERIVRALENPYVHALGHPTGRLIGERDPYDVDIDRVIEAARAHGKALEVNASYLRLDLNDNNVRKAVAEGVKIIICTDAHSTEQLHFMRLGVGTARRGWVTKADVLNTLNYRDLTKWLKMDR